MDIWIDIGGCLFVSVAISTLSKDQEERKIDDDGGLEEDGEDIDFVFS